MYLILKLKFFLLSLPLFFYSCIEIPDYQDDKYGWTPKDSIEPPDTFQKGLYISSIEPHRGSPKGGVRVEITGGGFNKNAKVFFDGSEGLNFVFQNENSILVDTPPHPPGFVDVKVILNDEKMAILKDGFFYEAEVNVHKIEPSSSCVEGGIPVFVQGKGFFKDSRLLIGEKLAIKTKVLNENEITGIAPDGEAGEKDVIVVNKIGQGVLKKGFIYGYPPVISFCFPMSIPAYKEAKVFVTGSNLESISSVNAGGNKVLFFNIINNEKIEILIPPQPEGNVDLRFDSPYGSVWNSKCITSLDYSKSSLSALKILNIYPPSSYTEGKIPVGIIAEGLGGKKDIEVLFDDLKAKILKIDEKYLKVVVEAPPHNEGFVDVSLISGKEKTILQNGFLYKIPLKIHNIQPQSASVKGGRDVVINGEGFKGILKVLLGAFPLQDIEIFSPSQIKGRTPEGSPGLSDVIVIRNDNEKAILKNGFLFEGDDGAKIFAVVPSHGAIAGGTWVKVYGQDLKANGILKLGSTIAEKMKVLHPTLIEGKTPAGEVGTVDVIYYDKNSESIIKNGFTYFDPKGYFGGIWGEIIDGSVNVTVLDSYTGKPVEEAFVILGALPYTEYKGLTNPQGQITISGRELYPPQSVTATHPLYDIFTYAGFNAENVTIFLNPKEPPPKGNGEGKEITPFPPAVLTGRIIGIDKYILVPPGSCEGKKLLNGVLCNPCKSDIDCGEEENLCIDLGGGLKYCTTPCKDHNDCPYGYQCYPVSYKKNRCIPSIGFKEIQCRTSSPSIFSYFPFEKKSFANEKGVFSILTKNLEELAIYCIGGVREPDTWSFTPLVMGIKRHIMPKGGKEIEGLNIYLNIPLSGKLRVVLDNPPGGKGGANDHIVKTFLELTSDGVIKIADDVKEIDGKIFEIKYLPQKLNGELFDAKYTFYAEANSQTETTLPYSAYLLRKIVPEKSAGFVIIENGKVKKIGDYTQGGINAIAEGKSGEIIAVGENGVFLIYDGEELYKVYSPSDLSFNAIFDTYDDGVVVVGDKGVIFRYKDGNFKKEFSGTENDLRGVHGTKKNNIYACGKYVILHYNGKEWKILPAPLRKYTDLFALSENDVWFVGEWGTIIKYDGISFNKIFSKTIKNLNTVNALNGKNVYFAGDDGIVLFYDGKEINKIPSPFKRNLYDIFIVSQNEVYFAGELGAIIMWNGSEWKNLSLLNFNGDIMSIVKGWNGKFFAGTKEDVVLGPFLWIPDFINPEEKGGMKDLYLKWDVKEGPLPDFSYIRLYGNKWDNLWSILSEGNLKEIYLPDLYLAAGLEGLPNGVFTLRILQVKKDNFSFDNFDDSSFYMLSWKGWMVHLFNFVR